MSQGTTVSVRSATEEDGPQVLRLLEAEGLESAFVPEEFLVAQDDHGFVGCARLAPLVEDLCELASVAVRPDRRGEEIGTALVHRALEGVEDPVHALCLQPGFFERFGFEVVDEVHPELEAKVETCCAERDFVPMVRRPEE